MGEVERFSELFLIPIQDAQVAEVENHLSRDTLQISNTRMRIERLAGILAELDEEIRQKNEIITRSESEIVKRNAVIERKQGVIDQYNKKLEQLMSGTGVRSQIYVNFPCKKKI